MIAKLASKTISPFLGISVSPSLNSSWIMIS